MRFTSIGTWLQILGAFGHGLTDGILDWARTNLPVFPDEAIDSESVPVFMPKSMREAHPDLKPVGENLVEIPNPLYAYRFAEGTDENIKVSDTGSTVCGLIH